MPRQMSGPIHTGIIQSSTPIAVRSVRAVRPRLRAVGAHDRLVPPVFEALLEKPTRDGLVLGDENSHGAGSPVSTGRSRNCRSSRPQKAGNAPGPPAAPIRRTPMTARRRRPFESATRGRLLRRFADVARARPDLHRRVARDNRFLASLERQLQRDRVALRLVPVFACPVPPNIAFPGLERLTILRR